MVTPFYSDFHRHITKLAVIVFLDSLLDFTGHIVAFRQIRLVGIGCLQTSSEHRDSEAVMLLAVAIRRYSDRITYCGSAVDDSSVVSAGVGERPLKWVAGRRLGPAEEQVSSSAGLCAARFRL
ncbi:hypothetical protein BKA60DRAFT_581924, partial [Fusarium oxysporum]